MNTLRRHKEKEKGQIGFLTFPKMLVCFRGRHSGDEKQPFWRPEASDAKFLFLLFLSPFYSFISLPLPL